MRVKVDVYTDGSYNEQLRTYGGGIVILVPGIEQPITSKVVGNDAILCDSRNIAGELLAVMHSMKIIDNLNEVTEITIHFDYIGVQHWLTGAWRTKKSVSVQYVSFMHPYCSKYKVSFNHVKGHSGDRYNELADKLAREGTFLPVKGE